MSTLAAGTAWAQAFPPNDMGVTMGHLHLNSRDVEANRKNIGFDVKNLEAFCKKLEAAGIKLDRPYTKSPLTGSALAFIYDPWGTYIELNERPSVQ
jgi:predicted enzyme related to lactoylglutathione lyase